MAQWRLRFWIVSKRFHVLGVLRSDESARVTTIAIYARRTRPV
jgi:hypothetical protein